MQTYNGLDVVVMVDNIEVTGFMDNTPIKAERSEDAVTAIEDLHGVAAFAISNSRLGEVEFTLSQTSPSLERMLELANSKKMVPVWVFSNNDVSEKAGGPKGIIKKTPAVEFGKEITGRTFVFLVTDFETTT